LVLKCYIVDSFIGFFAYNEDLKLVSAKPFENPEEAISQLYDLEKLGTCSILEDFVSDLLKMGYDSFIFEEELEAKSFKGKFNAESTVIAPSEGGRVFRSSTAEACEAAGVSPKQMEKMLKAVSESLLKNRVRTASEKRDRLVAQAVAAQDEIDKSVNIGVSRIREWYGLHFPELDTLVPDHKQYLKIITKFGTRSNLDEAEVNKIVQSDNKAKAICDVAKQSMGADIGGIDLDRIKELAEVNLKFYVARDELEKYIDDTMKEVAPNLRELIGAPLGGRLIQLMGSLENLAKKPASTIQVLGAEKALFRSLKTGARPPKHGIIFQHLAIHNAPRWQRGKIARALAGKIAIVARVDAFGDEFVAVSIKADLDRRIADIQKKYAKPPVREGRPERQFRNERSGRRDRWRGGSRGGSGGSQERWGGRAGGQDRGRGNWGRDNKWRR
jgi:nucleolar protein 56